MRKIYKKGDSVRIKTLEQFSEEYEVDRFGDIKTPNLLFVTDMHKHCGKKAIIIEVLPFKQYKIDIDSRFKYVAEMFEDFNEIFENVQIGDKVYSRLHGFGKVVKTVNLIIKCIFNNYPNEEILFWNDGKFNKRDEEPMLFYVDGDNKYATKRPVVNVPWDLVPVDTLCLVNTDESKRHYAGNMYCFINGMSSKTTDGHTTNWRRDQLKLGEDVTIDGVLYKAGSN